MLPTIAERARRHRELDRRQALVPSQKSRTGSSASRASGRRARRARPARGARESSPSSFARAGVDEEEVERRLGGQQLAPVAGEHVTSSSSANSSAAARRARVELDREERHAGRSAETIQAAPTPAPVPISPTRGGRARREHVQQPADLGLHERANPSSAPAPARAGRAAAARSRLRPVLPLPPHFDPARRRGLARRLRGPLEDARRWASSTAAAGRAGPLPDRARRRRRPEHVLHARLRALRRRPLGHRRPRRQPPALRVRLPEPRRDHADRADARHAPGAADLPPRSCSSTGRPPPEPYTLVTAEDVDPAAGASTRPSAEGSASTRSTPRSTSATTRARSRRAASTASRSGPSTRCSAGSATRSSSAVEEAIFFHSIAAPRQPHFQLKGDNPLTEHYSVLGPEVDPTPTASRSGGATSR